MLIYSAHLPKDRSEFIVPFFSPQPSACRFLGTRLGLLHAGLYRYRTANALPAFRVWHQRVFPAVLCWKARLRPATGSPGNTSGAEPSTVEERSLLHLCHVVALCHSQPEDAMNS
jgi:hypothetical protein